MKKLSRTISGVTPVAVMASPQGCPGKCIYCPTYPEAPQSYTPQSPAVLRAASCGYDARAQVEMRIRILSQMGHSADKIELIIMGGTFPATPVEYQYRFIKECYDGMNGCTAASLEEAKQINETAAHRCIGLCIETRPDWCTREHISRMLDFGTTRVELGVQTIDDEIFHLVGRGHGVKEVVEATRLLKNYGIKVYYHWMPGLPGSNLGHDLQMSRALFSDENYRPDGIKLYPTLVIRGTELEQWYNEGHYLPYTMDELVDLLVRIKSEIPVYVRIPRLMRDIPTSFIVAGCKDLALRSAVRKRMAELGLTCQCIRCREQGHRRRDGCKIGIPYLRRMDYRASGGQEIFLSFEDDNNTLFGLLRLRAGVNMLGMSNLAMVRELHVFGMEVPLGRQQDGAVQHMGLGAQLLKEAERIAVEEFGAVKIAVISGVGARDYFRSEFGYRLEGAYMVKDLGGLSSAVMDSAHTAV